MSVKEELTRRKLHKAHWFLKRRLAMTNKAGEKFSFAKSGEKFLRGYLGAAVCTLLLFYLRGKQMPAEVDVQEFQGILLAIVPLAGGLFDALANLVKFLKKPDAD